MKYPLFDKSKDDSIQSRLVELQGSPLKYDKFIDPLRAGPHLANIKGEEYFRSKDRVIGHSSPLTILNRHDGSKFPASKRLFK